MKPVVDCPVIKAEEKVCDVKGKGAENRSKRATETALRRQGKPYRIRNSN